MVVAAHEVGHEQAQLGEVIAEDEGVLAAEVRVGQPRIRILPAFKLALCMAMSAARCRWKNGLAGSSTRRTWKRRW